MEREDEEEKGAYQLSRVGSKTVFRRGGHLEQCSCSTEFCPVGSGCEGGSVVEALYEKGSQMAEGSKTMSRVLRPGRRGGCSLVSSCLVLRIS